MDCLVLGLLCFMTLHSLEKKCMDEAHTFLMDGGVGEKRRE